MSPVGVTKPRQDSGRTWTYALDGLFVGATGRNFVISGFDKARVSLPPRRWADSLFFGGTPSVSKTDVLSSFRPHRIGGLSWLTLLAGISLLTYHVWEDRNKEFSLPETVTNLAGGATFVGDTLFGEYRKVNWGRLLFGDHKLEADGEEYRNEVRNKSLLGHGFFVGMTMGWIAFLLKKTGGAGLLSTVGANTFFALNTLYTQNKLQKDAGDNYWEMDWGLVNVFTGLNFWFYGAGFLAKRFLVATKIPLLRVETSQFSAGSAMTLRTVMRYSAVISVMGCASFPAAYYLMDANLVNAVSIDTIRTLGITTLFVTPFRTYLGYHSLKGGIAAEVINQTILRGVFSTCPLFAGRGHFVSSWKRSLEKVEPEDESSLETMTGYYLNYLGHDVSGLLRNIPPFPWLANEEQLFLHEDGEKKGWYTFEDQDFWVVGNEISRLSQPQRNAFECHIHYLHRKILAKMADRREERLYTLLIGAQDRSIKRDRLLAWMDRWGPKSLIQ